MSGWLPIDEAAKCGDDVLLFSPDATEPKAFIGFWSDWEPLPNGSKVEACWVDSWTHAEIDTEPTHYMPLPEAPK